MECTPVFCAFELVGDSMLLRFAKLYSGSGCAPLRYGEWGLCKSGQNINGLCSRLRGYLPRRKVCVLIGTNDLLRISYSTIQLSREVGRVVHGINKIANVLKRKCEAVAFLTIPPVPRLECHSNNEVRQRYRQCREKLNSYIRGIANQKIQVLELDSLYLRQNGSIKDDAFERVMGRRNSTRPDLVHWNKKGMELAAAFLLANLV